MKRISLFFFSIVIIFSANSYVNGKSLGDSLDEKQLDISYESKRVEMLVRDIVLLPENNDFDRESALNMIMRISQIDPVILSFLAENNLKVKLFDGNITDEPYFQKLSGIVPRGWDNGLTWDDVPGGCSSTLAAAKIGASQTGMGHSSINLELHEIGHLFERNYPALKENLVYNSIWKEEAPKLMPSRQYFLDYQDEFFAEAFAMYYYDDNSREILKQNAPKTFELLYEIENNPVFNLNSSLI
ncbi:anthrax toxin lethal factor-related metalloendopeptidase [Calidifontibacillus oryziterrae]|uniref:anthrax toxin lethal factor-related metalloendopeptidase n=1 Tax=Calidifontibacillus oryziterrae TaxID=1191699 RepID=UPI0002F1F200|nr:hypothetical protein [Calidifontibacillus oryziterrae]